MARTPTLFYGSVCSGHCAVTQALAGHGWAPGFFAEIEAFPCAVLAHRFGAGAPVHPVDPEQFTGPERKDWENNNAELDRMAARGEFGVRTPNLGDFTKIDPDDWLRLDWLWAGTPCQDYSVAGARAGIDGRRGNLTLDFVDFAHALAARGSLRGFTWENVPGVLSDKRNAFGRILGAIVGHDTAIVSPHLKGRWTDFGVVVGPRARAAWRVLDTQHFGLPQRRRRVYLVASFGDGPDPIQILSEPKGLYRAAAPGPRAREDVAPTLSARTRGGGGQGTDFEVDGGLGPVPRLFSAMPMNSGRDFTVREVPVTQPVMASGQSLGDQGGDFVLAPIAPTITATYGEQSGQDQVNMALVLTAAPRVAHTLKAEGFDASEDGTGRQTLVAHEGLRPLAFGGNNTSGPIDVATARSAHAGPHGRLDFETETFIAEPGPFDTTQITSKLNRSHPAAGDPCHPLTAAGHPPAIAFNARQDPVWSADDVGALDEDGYSQAIAFSCKDYGADAGSAAPTLRAMGHSGSHPNAGGQVAVAFSVRGRDGEAQVEAEGDPVSPALRTGEGGSSKTFVGLAAPILEVGKRTGVSTTDPRAGLGIGEAGDPMYTLQAGAQHAVGVLSDTVSWAVRRLTPVECERLQGTADNFTRIPWRGRPAEECPDGPRYKVIGNSKSIDVVRWLGDRIYAAWPT